MKSLIWCTVLKGFGRVKVEEKSGGVESFNPIGGWHACLEKKGAYYVICRANDTFGFAVLGRGVRAGHAKGGTEREKKQVSSGIVKFATIVALN